MEVKEEEKPHPATSTTVHSNQQQPEIKNEKTQSHGVKGEGQSGQQLTTTSILTEDPNSTASSSVAPAAENSHRSGTPLEASVDSGSSSGDLLVVGSIGGGGDGGESGDGGDQVAAAADVSKKEKELKRPSFVVRPAPLEEDISESDDTDALSNEDGDEDEDDDDDENENEDNENADNGNEDEDEDEDDQDVNEDELSEQQRKEREERRQRRAAKEAEQAAAREERSRKRARERKIKRALRKFARDFPANLALERDVMLPVMRCLGRNDLLRCGRVCRDWNDWSHDPVLWPEVTVQPGTSMTAAILVGIVRRQPHHLDLSWCNVRERQLAWLLPRLPQLVSLKLTGVDGGDGLTLAALHSCNCPLLSSIDLSWTAAGDEHVRLLLSRPPDTRPGMSEGRSRLRYLSEVKFTGTKVTDETIRQLVSHLPLIEKLDLSECPLITDAGVAALAASAQARHRLLALNLARCRRLTDASLRLLAGCPTLQLLDLRSCEAVSLDACQRFLKGETPAGSTEDIFSGGSPVGLTENYGSSSLVVVEDSPLSAHSAESSTGSPATPPTNPPISVPTPLPTANSSTSRLVSHKKKILHSCRGHWQMAEERYFVKRPPVS